MNDAAKDLIEFLRTPGAPFEMDSWLITDSCGTVGCIAGTALNRFKGMSALDIGQLDEDEIVAKAGLVLGLETPSANHLFQPCEWKADLISGAYADQYRRLWRGNYRCDLTTIDRMKSFAESRKDDCIYTLINAPKAAECLERTLENHPHYVDWAEVLA